MLDLPSWVVVMLPLGLVLAVFFFAWRFVRRGAGAVHRAASRGDVECLKRLLLADARRRRRPGPARAAAAAIRRLVGPGRGRQRPARTWRRRQSRPRLESVALRRRPGARRHGRTAVGSRGRGERPVPMGRLDALARRRHQEATGDGDDFASSACADVDARTKSAWTPLHFAASDGNLELARLLLDHGADFQAVNAGEQTPLQVALGNGHPDIVELARSREQ